MRRPFLLYLLINLHLVLGISALYGGWSLLFDPVGLGVDPVWIARSPLSNYIIPGLFLFFVQGVFPLFIAIGLWKKPAWRRAEALNIYPNRHWAWTYSLFSGLILIGWISVQLVWLPSFWLQPLFIAVGLVILICTLWPGVMRYYETAVFQKFQSARS